SPAFALPDSHLAHGLRLQLDGRQGPWSAALWLRPALRPSWRARGLPGRAGWRASGRAWGRPGDAEGSAPRRSYQRFGALLGRTVIAAPRLLLRAEGTALGGRRTHRLRRASFP